MQVKDNLPPLNEPWNLIRVAIADLELAEKDPNVAVNMQGWFWSDDGGQTCSVCLAGAVMLQSLQITYDTNVTLYPSELKPDSLRKKLHALNNFRLGYFDAGLCNLDLPEWTNIYTKRHRVCSYSESAEDFKSGMLKLADELEQKFGNELERN